MIVCERKSFLNDFLVQGASIQEDCVLSFTFQSRALSPQSLVAKGVNSQVRLYA